MVARLLNLTAADQHAEQLISRDIGDLESAIENAKKMGNHFTRTHHVMTNPIVELNEDNATVRANLIATHVYRGDKPGMHYEVGWCTILCRSERLRGGGSPT